MLLLIDGIIQIKKLKGFILCEFDKKAIELLKKNINYILYPIIASLVAGFVLFNIQMMFETTKKQIEYLEKVKDNSELLFLKKHQLNKEKVKNLFSLLEEARKAFYKTINDNNYSDDKMNITIEYLKNIEKIYTEKINLKFEQSEALLLTKKLEMGFLNEKVYKNIQLLEIYSNHPLNDYKKDLIEQLSLVDTIYSSLLNHLRASLYQLTNKKYIIQNLRTHEDFIKLLRTFNNKKLEEDLSNIKKRNDELSIKVKELEIKIINEVNDKINGSIFDKIPYLFKSKIELTK